MKNYKVYLTIRGYIEIEAENRDEAMEIVENGYSMSDFYPEEDEIDDIEEGV